jgi:hypothetical protein
MSCVAGVNSGLSLTVNVEQYEYMTGPHDGAGVKVLMHAPNEYPMVHQLGMAVPTGAHAFLGVKVNVVSTRMAVILFRNIKRV